MARTLTDLKCKEPWLYWWLLLGFVERRKFFNNHFPDQQLPLGREQKKIMWKAENHEAIKDEEWLSLAEMCIDNPNHPPPRYRREIWRQVYRIASQKV